MQQDILYVIILIQRTPRATLTNSNFIYNILKFGAGNLAYVGMEIFFLKKKTSIYIILREGFVNPL